MHYFKFNIGDYAKKTARLSMLHHGAYTLLITSCYDRERFPTLEEAYDWLLPVDDAEKDAIKFVLNRYFTKEGDIYVQDRIREEIEAFHEKALKNKQIAIDREAAKKSNSTKRTRTVHDNDQKREPNQEPRTINQEPLTTISKARPKDAKEVEEYAATIDYFVDGQTFIDHYEANGWMRGKTKIKCWKSCLRTWKGKSNNNQPKNASPVMPKDEPIDLVAQMKIDEANRNGNG